MINVGDYVRTENGIAKCIYISKDNGDFAFDKSIFYDLDYKKTHILCKYCLQDEIDFGMKINSNIIDLIEPGDYVNNYLVNDSSDGLVIIAPTTNIDELNCINLSYEEKHNLIVFKIYKLEELNIKSIVTKEEYQNMEYKIEE